VNEAGYRNKFCPSGQSCTNNVCVEQKSDCPEEYECCVDEAGYKNKFCERSDATCIGNKCVTPGPSISYSLIGILAAVIVAGVVAFYFMRGRLGGGGGGRGGGGGKAGEKKEDAYEALKRKWAARRRR